METRVFCALMSVWRISCGLVLMLAETAPVVWCFGLIEVGMGGLSIVNAFKAKDVDASARGLLPPLIYTAGLYVAPSFSIDSNLQAMLWAIVFLRAWCLASLGQSVTCGASTFLEIKRGGPYAFVRHPMQLSGILARVMFCAAWPSPINLAGLVMMTVGSVVIVAAEEHYLRRFDAYAAYCERVRFRLLPGVW